MDKEVLDNLLANIGHVSSVYHLPAWAVSFKDTTSLRSPRDKDERQADDSSSDGDLLDIGESDGTGTKSDSFDIFNDSVPRERHSPRGDDFFMGSEIPFLFSCKDEVVLTPYQQGSKGQMGLQVSASLYRENDRMVMKLTLTNKTSGAISLQAIQFNKNSFGLSPSSPLEEPVSVFPDKTTETHVPLTAGVVLSNTPPANPIDIHVAIKTNVDIFYFRVFYELPIVLLYASRISTAQFEDLWSSMPSEESIDIGNVSNVVKMGRKIGLFYVGSGLDIAGIKGSSNACFYAMTTNSLRLLSVISDGRAYVKADAAALIPLLFHAIGRHRVLTT
uniref:Adaptin N terminal domain containing protein n=1 Tax=Babesia bovis TaxID=5865 RepID=S6BNM9_BABBO|nr:adaptin N terminal domain containing protein [Babesia bovis]